MSESYITKNALAASMKKLMEERDFSKVTVADICEGCGMNRKSFYYHFKDKYELVNWIFYEEFLKNMDVSRYKTSRDILEDLCKYFYRERTFYENALMVEGQNSFREYLFESMLPVIKTQTKDLFRDREYNLFFCVFLFTRRFLAAIISWLRDGEKIPPDEFLRQLHAILITLAENFHRGEQRVRAGLIRPAFFFRHFFAGVSQNVTV